MKNLSYQQVIHIKLWITFLFIFQKITLQTSFYVLQYKHNKTKNKIHRKVKGD